MTESLLIKMRSLTELELDEFLQGVGEHLHKNNLEHLINNAFDMDGDADRVAELEDELEHSEDEVIRLKGQVDELTEELEKLKKTA